LPPTAQSVRLARRLRKAVASRLGEGLGACGTLRAPNDGRPLRELRIPVHLIRTATNRSNASP